MRKILIEIDGKQYILDGDDLQLFDNWLLKDILRVAGAGIYAPSGVVNRCLGCNFAAEAIVRPHFQKGVVMKTIRCQVRMIDHGQVDVTVEDNMLPALLIKAIEEKVRSEFGGYDNVEIELIEDVPQIEAV